MPTKLYDTSLKSKLTCTLTLLACWLVPLASSAGEIVVTVQDRQQVVAIEDGTKHVLIDLEKQIPADRFRDGAKSPLGDYTMLALDQQADFDGDGRKDYLIAVGYGGTACPGPGYLIVTPMGGGAARISDVFGDCSRGISAEASDGNTTFTIDRGDSKEFWTYDKGKVQQQESLSVGEMTAVVEIRVEDVEQKGGRTSVQLDIDGDGKSETMACEMLRFLSCTFTDDDGKTLATVMGSSKRLGILETKTNGLRDLVMDENLVLHWDGKDWVK